MTLVRISAAEAYGILFAAASLGGAYNHGEGGAYGRLSAWRSIGALAGASEDDAQEAVSRTASACAWYSFSAETWFYYVAWDIGLLALRPDGGTLAVLAASDTD